MGKKELGQRGWERKYLVVVSGSQRTEFALGKRAEAEALRDHERAAGKTAILRQARRFVSQ